MKSKYLRSVFAGMVCATMFFAGCGGGDDVSIVGMWTWSKLTIDGLTLNLGNPANPITAGGSTVITPAWITETAAAQGVPGVSVSLTATFSEDGSLTLAGSASAPGQGTQTIPALPPVTWAQDGDTLVITSEGVTLNINHSVTDSTLTLTATTAELEQMLADAAAAAGMTPAQIQAMLTAFAAELGFTVGTLPTITVTVEFSR